MGTLALCLVLGSSFLHAAWNLLAKRAGGGAAFVFAVAASASVLFTPIVIGWVIWRRPEMGVVQYAFILGSGIVHLGYYLVLQHGYRVADLSVVYPLARGTGPAISTVGAILLLGERPSALALVGAGLVIAGVLLIAIGPRPAGAARHAAGGGVAYGLLTGAFIAAYTLIDKRAVSGPSAVDPLVLDYGSHVVRATMVWPLVRGHGRRWRTTGAGTACTCSASRSSAPWRSSWCSSRCRPPR